MRAATSPPAPEFVVGVDLGQVSDYTAVAMVEDAGRERTRPRLVRHLARFALSTRYPEVVAEVLALLQSPPLAGRVRLGVDQTGVGRAVTDVFRAEMKRRWQGRMAPQLVAVTITGGNEVTAVAGGRGVPKRDLVNAIAIPLEAGYLKIAPELPEASVLVRELDEFQRTVSAAGRDSYGGAADWRVNAHDDLLLATGIALWVADHARPATLHWL